MIKRTKLLTVWAILASSLSGCQQQESKNTASVSPATPPADAVAIINGTAITATELKERMAQAPNRHSGYYNRLGKGAAILDELVEEELIYQQARKDGIAADPKIVARVAAFERRLLIARLSRERRPQVIEPTPAEVKAFFEAQKERYSRPERIDVRHIFTRDNRKIGEAAAKLAQGGDFTALVEEYSEDRTSAERGGYVGRFERHKTEVTEIFMQTASKLDAGSYSKPFLTNQGYHIVMVDKIWPAQIPVFGELEAKVKQDLINKRALDGFEAWVSTLRAAAEIKIIPSKIPSALPAE